MVLLSALFLPELSLAGTTPYVPPMPGQRMLSTPAAPTTSPAAATTGSLAAAFCQRLLPVAVPGFLFFYLIAFLLLLAASNADSRCLSAQLLVSGMAATVLLLTFPLIALLVWHWFAPTVETWIAGAFTLLGIASLRWAGNDWQRERMLRHTPLSRLRSAPAGFAKVRGRTRAAYGTIDAGSGLIPSLYYKRVTQQYRLYRNRQGSSYHWETLSSVTEAQDFVLEEDGMNALVKVQNAQFVPDNHAYFYNGAPVSSLPWGAEEDDQRILVDYVAPDTTLTIWGHYADGCGPEGAENTRVLSFDLPSRCLLIVEGDERRIYTRLSVKGWGLTVLGILLLLVVVLLLAEPTLLANLMDGVTRCIF
ncbi:MAG TPA: hypothetical protein VHR86_07355 [Armatimonadota bacterium]|nr:hypothetical protein [Armatimonadota bacterium]